MKLIKANFNIIEQGFGIDGIYKIIEQAGRTCYRSEDKITETSAKEFVDRMIKSGHGAMLEHGTVYLAIPVDDCEDLPDGWVHKLFDYSNGTHDDGNTIKSPWIKVEYIRPNFIITTNYRWVIENDATFMLKYLCEPTEFHEKRVCVRFVCDRGVSHEFVRHRVFSFAQESTRYCNYSKDKFGNELTFIIPCWMDIPEGSIELGNYDKTSARYKDGNLYIIDGKPPYTGVDLIRNLCESESDYLLMLNRGWTPQQARAVLPNALKTELVMTGFVKDWKHFFELRCDTAAHPQARELAIPLKEEFIKRGYIKT